MSSELEELDTKFKNMIQGFRNEMKKDKDNLCKEMYDINVKVSNVETKVTQLEKMCPIPARTSRRARKK